MDENTASTSETETGITALYRWVPGQNGISRTTLTCRYVEVRGTRRGEVLLSVQRDFEPPTVLHLSPEAARHIAGLLVAAASAEGA